LQIVNQREIQDFIIFFSFDSQLVEFKAVGVIDFWQSNSNQSRAKPESPARALIQTGLKIVLPFICEQKA